MNRRAVSAIQDQISFAQSNLGATEEEIDVLRVKQAKNERSLLKAKVACIHVKDQIQSSLKSLVEGCQVKLSPSTNPSTDHLNKQTTAVDTTTNLGMGQMYQPSSLFSF